MNALGILVRPECSMHHRSLTNSLARRGRNAEQLVIINAAEMQPIRVGQQFNDFEAVHKPFQPMHQSTHLSTDLTSQFSSSLMYCTATVLDEGGQQATAQFPLVIYLLESSPMLPTSGLLPLTSVAVVCREFPGISGSEVEQLVSDFVDVTSEWIVSKVRRDILSVWLLKRLHARERLDPLINDPFFREYQFSKAANRAGADGKLEVLKWLVTEYSPGSVMTKATWRAARNGQLEVIKWLYEEYPFVVVGFEELRQAAIGSHLEVVKYLLANPPSPEHRIPQISDKEWDFIVHSLLRSREVFEHASLEFLQWMLESGYISCGWKLHDAAISNQFDALQSFAGYMDAMYKTAVGSKDVRSIKMDMKQASARIHCARPERWSRLESEKEEFAAHQASRGLHWQVYDTGEDSDEEYDPEIDDSPDVLIDVSLLSELDAFEIAKWFYEQNFSWLKLEASIDGIASQASYGNIEFVKWLHGRLTTDWANWAVKHAGITRNFELLKWLHEKCPQKYATSAINDAATYKHIEAVKWLHEHSTEKCSDEGLANLIRSGCFDTVKWLLQNSPELNPVTALKSLVDFRIQHEYVKGPLDTSLTETKDLAMARWLFENFQNQLSDPVNADSAASRGNLSLLQFLLENRIAYCSSSAMDDAATNNQLDVVKWLHEHRTEGCTTRAMDNAARNGYLEMVKWLHTNRTEGCTTQAMDGAIAGGHVDVAKWLYENRNEGASPCQIDQAARNGCFEMVRWLTEDCAHEPFAQCTTSAMDNAAINGDLRMVRYLHENRTEGCTTDAMDYAAWYGHFQVVLFLYANRNEGCTGGALTFSFDSEHFEVVRWLVHHYPHLYDRLLEQYGNEPSYIGYWVKNRSLPVREQNCPE